MKENVKQRAADYLAAHEGVEALHSTSDGYLFEVKQHAVQHSLTLEDKKVETHKREANAQAPTPQEGSEEGKPEEKPEEKKEATTKPTAKKSAKK